MAHEPKLTVYTLTIAPEDNCKEVTNRWLFRNIIGEANEDSLTDELIFTDLFKQLVAKLDRQEMYKDQNSQKSITANQPDLVDPTVEPNLYFKSSQYILGGVIEGGSYGRRRKKTSILDKANKAPVNENDAITSDFFFLVYAPPRSRKIVLMIQSYEGDSIDAVMKNFFSNFFSVAGVFKRRTFHRFVPKAIIDDFKKSATVSTLKFTTDVPGKTLLEAPSTSIQKNFRVSVTITPIGKDLTLEEFDTSVNSLRHQSLWNQPFSIFKRRKGSLKDNTTDKRSTFDLDSNFEIKPVILLSKYINLDPKNINFDDIKKYCHELLEREVIPQIYMTDAIRER